MGIFLPREAVGQEFREDEQAFVPPLQNESCFAEKMWLALGSVCAVCDRCE